MIVLLTGLARSGSTWAFNIARVLLLARTPAVYGEYRDDIAGALAAADAKVEHHLIKTHAPDAVGRALIEQGTCRTICTVRNPLECLTSQIERFGASFEDALAAIHAGLAFLRVQASIGGVRFLAYEDIVERPAAAVGAIARYLDLAVSPADADRIADRFSKENVARFTERLKNHAVDKVGATEAWESDTLFHADHIRAHPSAPEALLSVEQLGHATARLGDFIDQRGRLVDALRRQVAQPL